MLIEFIGFSSSGKTKLIKKICVNLKEKKIDFNDIELEFLNKSYPSKLNKKYLSFLLNFKFIFLFLFKFFNFKKTKNILLVLKQTNISFFKKNTYFRNYIKKVSLIEYYKSKNYKDSKKILLFDEGIIQGVLNIFNHINNDSNSLNLEDFDFMFYPDILVYLKPDRVELLKRIKKRNDRKFWNSLSDKELNKYINNFNNNVEKVIELYEKKSQNKFLKISNNSHDNKNVINSIIQKLEEAN